MARGKANGSTTGASLGYNYSSLETRPETAALPNLAEDQVKSKRRVTDHGEVFTGKREVNAMLDMVRSETERIDSRFLEPACGNGNFLGEILMRKLHVVRTRYGKHQLDYERNAVLAVSSVYGVDILEDNVQECRNRLCGIFTQEYDGLFKARVKERCREAVRIILNHNIIWGDALSLMTVGENPQPIIFSEWTFPFHDSRIKRSDFKFSELIPTSSSSRGPESLFSPTELVSDLGGRVFIPDEIHSESPVSFLKIGDAHE